MSAFVYPGIACRSNVSTLFPRTRGQKLDKCFAKVILLFLAAIFIIQMACSKAEEHLGHVTRGLGKYIATVDARWYKILTIKLT